MTDKVKRLKNGECRVIKINEEAVNDILRSYFCKNTLKLFRLKSHKASLLFLRDKASGDFICIAKRKNLVIDHKTEDFLIKNTEPTSVSVCDFKQSKYINAFLKDDNSLELCENVKNTSLSSNEIRIIRIEEQAIEEVLFEFFIDNVCEFFDLLCPLNVFYKMSYENETSTACFAVFPHNEKILKDYYGVLLEEIIDVPITTETVFGDFYHKKRYLKMKFK